MVIEAVRLEVLSVNELIKFVQDHVASEVAQSKEITVAGAIDALWPKLSLHPSVLEKLAREGARSFCNLAMKDVRQAARVSEPRSGEFHLHRVGGVHATSPLDVLYRAGDSLKPFRLFTVRDFDSLIEDARVQEASWLRIREWAIRARKELLEHSVECIDRLPKVTRELLVALYRGEGE